MAQTSPAATPVDESFHSQPVSPRNFGMHLWTAAAMLVAALGTVLCWRAQYTVDYEMSLLPWLVSRGWVLYRDAIDQHTPLLPMALAVGGAGDPQALHYVIAGLHLAILVLAWAGASLIAGRIAGFLAVAFTEAWSVSFESTHLWYDMALAPLYLAVLAVLCSRWAVREPRGALAASILAGILVGVGTLVKQHALLMLPFATLALYLQTSVGRRARLAGLMGGFALPILLMGLYFAAKGALSVALYWTVAYSFVGDYVRLSALGPSPGEWPILALLYAPAVAALLAWPVAKGRWRWQLPLLLVLLVPATLAAYPRYGRFHFAAAVPLLGVICGVVVVHLAPYLRAALASYRIRAASGVAVALLSLVWGVLLWVEAQGHERSGGGRYETPLAPYESTIAPLRGWVDSHAGPGAPVAGYGLDPLIYRALEREPTRPFVPQVPWIILEDDRQAQVWAGIEAAQPSVALVSSTGWASSPGAGDATIEGRLRHFYHEDRRYSVVVYPGAPPVQVVCLLRNER